jgi:vacuolar-type H+-ATPase subunit I/STV1
MDSINETSSQNIETLSNKFRMKEFKLETFKETVNHVIKAQHEENSRRMSETKEKLENKYDKLILQLDPLKENRQNTSNVRHENLQFESTSYVIRENEIQALKLLKSGLAEKAKNSQEHKMFEMGAYCCQFLKPANSKSGNDGKTSDRSAKRKASLSKSSRSRYRSESRHFCLYH